MADRPAQAGMEPEDPALAIAARHALHDEELIAAFATDGDAAEDATRARSLIERCVACRDLHADVVAIAGVLKAAENAEAVAATRSAPRDFRLSVETANRLRPGSVVLRLRDRVAAAVASFSRPIGMSMASLGVVGLLLGTLTLGGFGALGTAPRDNGAGDAGGMAAEIGASPGTAQGATRDPGVLTAPGASALATARLSFDAKATASPGGASPGARSPAPSPPPMGATTEHGAAVGGSIAPTLVVAGSAVLIVAGIALLLVGSRRREPIPGR